MLPSAIRGRIDARAAPQFSSGKNIKRFTTKSPAPTTKSPAGKESQLSVKPVNPDDFVDCGMPKPVFFKFTLSKFCKKFVLNLLQVVMKP